MTLIDKVNLTKSGTWGVSRAAVHEGNVYVYDTEGLQRMIIPLHWLDAMAEAVSNRLPASKGPSAS